MSRGKIMRQVNVPWIGAWVNIVFTTLPFFSLINFLSIVIVLYATTHTYLKEYTPWATFWMFLIVLLVLIVVTMYLVYRFVIPSMWTYREKQMFGFSSEISNLLRSMDERLERLEGTNNQKEERPSDEKEAK